MGDCGVDVQDDDDGIALPNLDHSVQEKNSNYVRPFRFAEFFAGWGGLSSSMKFIGGDWIEVSATLDGFAGAWNILDDAHFEESKKICESVDHAHMAPPCRTLTKSRRSDEHGTVKVLRSEQHPEGWGDSEAVEANLVISRMVILCLLLHRSGATFAIENPWDSFLWQLRCMVKVMQIKSCELILLHQCAYGAASQKATGILTTAAWVKAVCSLCFEVRFHRHVPLVGKAWSFLDNCEVWRTSLAAEYPCGLCVAWSKSLMQWLSSPLGYKWMQARSFVRTGRWNNVLVRQSLEDRNTSTGSIGASSQLSLKEVREAENSKAVGGLRKTCGYEVSFAERSGTSD